MRKKLFLRVSFHHNTMTSSFCNFKKISCNCIFFVGNYELLDILNMVFKDILSNFYS